MTLLTHAKLELHFHLVLVTNCRRKNLDAENLSVIKNSFNTVAAKYGIQLEEINIDEGKADHCHFLFELQQISGVDLSKFITSLKSRSSRLLKSLTPDFSWSASYYLATVSSNNGELDAVKNYIRNQGK